jgi:hypothetical protein
MDDTVPYLSYRIINLILPFFGTRLTRIDYLLIIYNTQNGITIKEKYI